ncbi:carbohydrate ABC transporter substrate-binding protein (CUT1 family) [Kribbella amoyensis]|uniref:Carbohydrate ABC transporter substrate-binding protein (CUT1 family) n=1 Tax=Kribbella amoyensis TaxID=996641 RepID=A0A561B7U7_9ACTN|nr:extracellular solute-binding protein [Kribbella amoyensis]TWD74913.1 carbohydrate ABC transporter substrate-binding protein (CUT1 family) [Kribbella amoyensis]
MSNTSPTSRRAFLRTAGGVALGIPLLSACTGSGESSQSAGADPSDSAAGPVTVTWWDHYRPLTELFEKKLFVEYKKDHGNVTLQRRQLDPADLGQALQLARRSNQLPDVHSTAGLGGSAAALVTNGWFQPLDDLIDLANNPLKDYLYDGIHRFDGKVYTFPVFSGNWHDSTTWVNTALVKRAGLDPEQSPKTWDEYRAAIRTIDQKTPDSVHGLLLPMKDTDYLAGKLNAFAQMAGAPGQTDWKTGETIVATDPFFEAMEFLLALQKDGVLHPASSSLGPRDARARWAAGEAALFAWGPWFIGGLMVEESPAVKRGISAWQIPAPTAQRGIVYVSPSPGSFFVSDQAKNPKVAADVMARMTTPEFAAQLATRMDQPPILTDAVAKAEVHPAYRKNVEFFQQDVRIAPVPEVRNAGVAKVLAEMRDVHPSPGEIVQAVLTGSTKDYKAALKQYADKATAERKRAIDAAKKKGAEVSDADWVFDNWQPGQDYTQSSYK